jgi:hypothetical protein
LASAIVAYALVFVVVTAIGVAFAGSRRQRFLFAATATVVWTASCVVAYPLTYMVSGLSGFRSAARSRLIEYVVPGWFIVGNVILWGSYYIRARTGSEQRRKKGDIQKIR